MIIKNENTTHWNFKALISRMVLFLSAILLIIASVAFFIKKDVGNHQMNFSSSFDNTQNGLVLSDRETRNGSHSVLIEVDSMLDLPFFEMDYPQNLYGKAQVWVKSTQGNPILSLHANASNSSFHRSSTQILKTENGWSCIELKFRTIRISKSDTLIFSLGVEGETVVFLDDFQVDFSNTYESHPDSLYQVRKVNLRIDEKDFARLERKRNEAVEKGLLVAKEDDWVSADVFDDDRKMKAKVRLKGDWVDHLKGDKWSYRVKMKKDDTWLRMKTVSFQSPEARGLLGEWMLHQLWKREDILTTRYDFITLEVNGVSKGIYAYEEHFEKQLLEFNARREGPIVRFNESASWDIRERAMETFQYLPDGLVEEKAQFERSEIEAFGENKIAASPSLSRQYIEAQNLMFRYQQNIKKASEVFDLDQIAKYYALCDLMDADHATIWFNQRFYYNPVTSKLEPIGYDGNPGLLKSEKEFKGQDFLGSSPNNSYQHIFGNLIQDHLFIEKYIFYLNQFTQEKYVEDFIQEIKPAAFDRINLLKTEFPAVEFGAYKLRTKAKKIQILLHPYNEHSLIANTVESKDDTKTIQIRNKHIIPLEILGTGNSLRGYTHPIDTLCLIMGNSSARKLSEYDELEIPINAKYIFSKPLGLDTIVYSKIKPHPVPNEKINTSDLFSDISLDTSIYKVEGNRIIFSKGKQIINKRIVIPSGYKVVFEAGVELDFINGAAFISQSPIIMYGTEEAPIQMISSDNSAKGFTVLQANEKSIIHHVLFSGWDTWSYENWLLTGAVTFYESDVDINFSKITSNQCEDALNIIRSDFIIRGLMISNTFADGFDADFCKGYIHDATFLNTGNDGMDFSGSKIHIENANIDQAGDKGLSVGEESNVSIKNINISNSILAVASKDLSKLEIENIQIENCQQGFAAYRKKPEYGGGSIHVKKYEIENVKQLQQVEKGSVIILE